MRRPARLAGSPCATGSGSPSAPPRAAQHGGGGGSPGRARASRRRARAGPGERSRRRRHRGVDVRLEGLLRHLGLASRRLAERGQTTTKRRRLVLKRLHLLGRRKFARDTASSAVRRVTSASAFPSARIALAPSGEPRSSMARARRAPSCPPRGRGRLARRRAVDHLAAALGGGGGEGGDARCAWRIPPRTQVAASEIQCGGR